MIQQVGDRAKFSERGWSITDHSPSLQAEPGSKYPLVLVSPKLTPTPPMSSATTIPTSKTMAIVKPSTGVKYPTLICLSEEARARISASQEKELDLWGREVASSPSTSVRLKKSVPLTSFGRMSEVYLAATEDGTLPQYSIKWPKQGILSNGKFSTPSTSVSLKTESVSLSSVLVPTSEVPEKYFLSRKQEDKIFATLNQVQDKPTDATTQKE